MNRIITLNDLVELKACEDGVAWFVKYFPEGIEIQQEIIINDVDDCDDVDVDDVDESNVDGYINWFYNNIIGNKSCDSSSQEVFYTCKYVSQNGYQNTYLFNEAGQIIHYSHESTGYWQTREYNEAGLETRYEDSDGDWKTYEYNEAGQETRYEESDGYWRIFKYNDAGQETRHEDSDGYLETWSYNEDGEVIDYTSE